MSINKKPAMIDLFHLIELFILLQSDVEQ